jgi:UDP-N-acetyl-D-galactosamine dehydrogenase
MTASRETIAVVGLGYVGLPARCRVRPAYATIGFDLSQKKIDAYRSGSDPTAR